MCACVKALSWALEGELRSSSASCELADGLVELVGDPGGELELVLDETRALEEAVLQAHGVDGPTSS